MRGLVALALVVVAGFMPAASFSATEQFSRPPPVALGTVAALGRSLAAGAAYWMATSQLLGRGRYEQAGYPGLEDWLSETFKANPYLRDAYVLGAVTLLVDPERSGKMRTILAQGESRFPTDFQFPMLQGVAAYFGEFDSQAAAKHFQRASKLPMAPPFLASFGRRLEEQVNTCGTVLLNLRSVAKTERLGDLERQSFSVYEKCTKRELEQAAAAFKINNARVPSGIEELVAEGYIERLPAAPDRMCWRVININAFLLPCESSR